MLSCIIITQQVCNIMQIGEDAICDKINTYNTFFKIVDKHHVVGQNIQEDIEQQRNNSSGYKLTGKLSPNCSYYTFN